MLDKMAEMVREDKSVLCDLCPYIPNEADCINAMVCPSIADIPEDRLARWAVLLVARALEEWVAEIDRTNGVDLGDVEALGSEFMDLYYEVKKAEAKEAAHDPRQPL